MVKMFTRFLAYVGVVSALLWVLIMAAPAAAQEPNEPKALPPAVSDWKRLTPRQYLWLRYPDDAELLDRIIRCESGYDPRAKNNNSSASGIAQFISSTWVSSRDGMGRDPALDLRFDPYENIDTAVWLLHAAGPTQWECYTLYL